MSLVPVDPKNEDSVVMLLERVHDWLATAVERSEVSEIAAVKAQIATAAEATKQLNLSKEIQLDAQEMVRRAEYALGKAIRKGQAEGLIRTKGERGPQITDYERIRNGQHEVVRAPVVEQTGSLKPGPTDFATHEELYGNKSGVMHLVDGVTDEQFNAALDGAKAEDNLSRANVVRKVRGSSAGRKSRADKADLLEDLAAQGYSSRQMCKALGFSRDDAVRELAREFGIEIPADKTIGRSRRINSTDVVVNTATALEGLVMGVELIDYEAVDPEAASQWVDSLTESMRVLNRFVRQIKETTQCRVDHIAANMDLEQLGTPTVNKRGGLFYVIDGQHRIEAYKQWIGEGWENQQLHCWTYDGLTETEEAETFLKLNDTLTVQAFDKFRIGLNADRPEEMEIAAVVQKAGLTISQSRAEGTIGAVGTLRRVYRREGHAVLARALGIIRDAYGTPGLEAQVIDGIGLLCGRYNGELDTATAVTRLASVSGGLAGLMNRAYMAKNQTNAPLNQCVAAAAVDLINRGKGGKKLPSWWKTEAA